jgi:hypothetical protein
MIKKQTPTLHKAERMILITCIVIYILMPIALQTIFFAYSYLFLLLIIIDAVLLSNIRTSESLKRILLLVNFVGVLSAIYYLIGATMPWVFQ